MNLKNFSKKFIVFLISILIAFESSVLIAPQKAEAKDIVFDPAVLAKIVLQTAKEWAIHELEKMDTVLRDIAVRRMVKIVTNQTIEWIQGGGEPQFVSNWEDYLNQAYNKGGGEALEEIPASYICPEFRDELQQRLGITFSDNPLPSDGWVESLKCTLGENNYSFTEPQNNLYGAYTLILNQVVYRGGSRAQAAQNEAIAGKGYTSPKKCLESDDLGRCLKEIITTPANTIADVLSKAMVTDIDYVTNIQSVLGAVINAVLDNLLNEGLAEMSPVGERAGWNEENASLVAKDLESQKQFYLKSYQTILKEEQAILSVKNQSLNVAKNLPRLCYNNLEAKISDLQSQINQLNAVIDEVNDAIVQINNITKDNYDTEMPKVTARYSEFMETTGDQIYEDSFTGDARNAAEQELQQLKMAQQQCLIRI